MPRALWTIVKRRFQSQKRGPTSTAQGGSGVLQKRRCGRRQAARHAEAARLHAACDRNGALQIGGRSSGGRAGESRPFRDVAGTSISPSSRSEAELCPYLYRFRRKRIRSLPRESQRVRSEAFSSAATPVVNYATLATQNSGLELVLKSHTPHPKWGQHCTLSATVAEVPRLQRHREPFAADSVNQVSPQNIHPNAGRWCCRA